MKGTGVIKGKADECQYEKIDSETLDSSSTDDETEIEEESLIVRDDYDIAFVRNRSAALQRQKMYVVIALGLVGLILLGLGSIFLVLSKRNTVDNDDDDNDDDFQRLGPKPLLMMECPVLDATEGSERKPFADEEANVTHYLETFRTQNFHGWDMSFNEFVTRMFRYRADTFASLQSGQTIFESACGSGMNLAATLEILEKSRGVTNLTVYGNDPMASSVQKAHQLMRAGFLPAGGQEGGICQGDSTNLSFVPSNSFDPVYTGYIVPVWDPLNSGFRGRRMWAYYNRVCAGRGTKAQQLRERMRHVQEAWYTKWVSEMFRIAKPGAPIIVEQVSQSYCSFQGDWDGVDRLFWRTAMERGDWKDVDVDSLAIEVNNIARVRDNVFMRKKI